MRKEKPSATACLIAASLGFSSRDPDLAGLVNPLAGEASAWFMRAYGMPASLFVGCLKTAWVRRFTQTLERCTMPGIQLHYILRKRYLEETARRFLDEGLRQIVVLGGGFDTLALSLHKSYPQAVFLEIDFPATQDVKKRALDSKHKVNENMHFLPIDFMKQTLAESLLKHPRYQPAEKTLFIAEGVLMYLSEAEVVRLFEFVQEHSGPESCIAFTFMELRPDGGINFHNRSRIVDSWMKIRGEPFTWGIERDHLPGYLTSRGFSLVDLTTPQLFRSRYLEPAGLASSALAEGEYVCLAKKL